MGLEQVSAEDRAAWHTGLEALTASARAVHDYLQPPPEALDFAALDKLLDQLDRDRRYMVAVTQRILAQSGVDLGGRRVDQRDGLSTS